MEVVSGNGEGFKVGDGCIGHSYIRVKVGRVGEGDELLLLPVLRVES